MTIGEKVKLCRVEKVISQKELATLIGVDVSFICKVEKIVKKSPVKNITTKYLKNIIAIVLFKKVSFKDSKIPNCKLLIKLKR